MLVFLCLKFEFNNIYIIKNSAIYFRSLFLILNPLLRSSTTYLLKQKNPSLLQRDLRRLKFLNHFHHNLTNMITYIHRNMRIDNLIKLKGLVDHR